MYRSILFLFILFVCSCTKEEKVYNKAELNQYVDSSLKVKMPILRKQAKEDFLNRMPIELKFKIDSILKVSYAIPAAPELGGQSSINVGDSIDTTSSNKAKSIHSTIKKSTSEIKK